MNMYARVSFCTRPRIQDSLESILKLFDVVVKEIQVLYLKKKCMGFVFLDEIFVQCLVQNVVVGREGEVSKAARERKTPR